jgi:hypothetical protein
MRSSLTAAFDSLPNLKRSEVYGQYVEEIVLLSSPPSSGSGNGSSPSFNSAFVITSRMKRKYLFAVFFILI